MKKLIFPIFCLMALLASCGNGETEQPETKQDTAAINVTVNETSTTAEDEWGLLQDGVELAVVNVTITNNTEESYDFNPNYIFIQYDGNQEYVTFLKPVDKEYLSSYIIKPGESITGNLIYEVTAGTEDFDIYFDDHKTQMELPH